MFQDWYQKQKENLSENTILEIITDDDSENMLETIDLRVKQES